MNNIALADAPRELAKLGVRVSYRKLYDRVLNGDLPAFRGENGRWYFAPRDLPSVAKALRLASSEPKKGEQ